MQSGVRKLSQDFSSAIFANCLYHEANFSNPISYISHTKTNGTEKIPWQSKNKNVFIFIKLIIQMQHFMIVKAFEYLFLVRCNNAAFFFKKIDKFTVLFAFRNMLKFNHCFGELCTEHDPLFEHLFQVSYYWSMEINLAVLVHLRGPWWEKGQDKTDKKNSRDTPAKKLQWEEPIFTNYKFLQGCSKGVVS